ncbi:MAG: glycosyltransferase [Alphaproteobacteria bacterium]|nr:glycosyltransferase [Alphaproteobacteria bacterium]
MILKTTLFILISLFPLLTDASTIKEDDISAFSPVIIKSTTNRDETNNGDYFIANDMAKGFSLLGLKTDIDYRTEYHKTHASPPKLNIYMRGYTKFHSPFGNNTNLLYIYYPLLFDKNSAKKDKKSFLNSRSPMPQNSNLDDDLKNFDIIAVASSSYTETLNKNGINAIYIPQFTNPTKFYPNPKEELKTDILFVGSNWHDRTSLRYAIELGYDVSVYGYNWQNIISPKMYKAMYIPNNILNQYYSSAKIVLNDHRPDMKEFGFINNRIFDATASGALVISDYMKEIEDIYQDCIPMYKTKEDLKNLIDYYLKNEDKRQEKAICAQQITLKEYTNTAIAKKIINHLKSQKKGD